MLCENPSLATAAFNGQFANDPKQIAALYRPRDPADKTALDAMNTLFKDAERLRANARAVRNDAAGDGCEWVMSVDLSWTNSFGQPRRKTVQMRTELEAVNGAPRVRRIFGGSGF